MGIGPVPAIKAALNKADKNLQHMELIEVLKLKWQSIVGYLFYIVILSLVNQVVLFKNNLGTVCILILLIFLVGLFYGHFKCGSCTEEVMQYFNVFFSFLTNHFPFLFNQCCNKALQ